MLRTVIQALIDEIPYPIGVGFIENKLLSRGISGDDEISADIIQSSEFKGAVADCLYSLIEAPNVSEAGMSLSLSDRNLILKKANSLYKEIGEDEKSIDKPTVKIGW